MTLLNIALLSTDHDWHHPWLFPLIPLWLHDEASKTPAAKGVPVRIAR